MDLSSFYRERIQDFARKESAYERKNNRFTWLRLLLVVSMIALGIYFYSISFWLSIVTVGILFITFLISLKKKAIPYIAVLLLICAITFLMRPYSPMQERERRSDTAQDNYIP